MKTLVYGSSIKGNRHFIDGVECQDSHSFSELDFTDDEIKVVAVSDGHGGAPYYRSSQGSRFAVEIAKRELYAFVCNIKANLDAIDSAQRIIDAPPPQFVMKPEGENALPKDTPELSLLKSSVQNIEKKVSMALNSVKEAIIKAWNRAVDEALAATPIDVIEAQVLKFDSITEEPTVTSYVAYGTVSDMALQFASHNPGKGIVDSLRKNPRQVYGATLLAVAQYKEHIFVLQIGDGDVTLVDAQGHAENPIQKNEYLMAGQTDSLCQSFAVDRMKSLYMRRRIKMAMLSTDGISNALEQEADLFQIALEIYESIEEEPADFRREFKPSIRPFSDCDGDDCTIGLIANDISEASYEIIKNSPEAEEEHGLDATRQPLLGDYTLNGELYLLGETPLKGQVASTFNFQKVGMAALPKSLMKAEYTELIESREQLAAMHWHQSLLLDVLSYGKRYFDEREKALKAAQEAAYRRAIDDVLLENPLWLMKCKTTKLVMDPTGALQIHEGKQRVGIVQSVKDRTMEYAPITADFYDQIQDNFKSLVAFIGDYPLKGQYKLNINKYDITLKKES